MESTHEGDAHDLRIVLLGVSGAGKSSIGNAILGREAFKESRTRESEKQRGRVEDRNISIIDTPGFFNTELTDEEMKKQMMKSLYLSYPGPHVFLLVINLENFEEDKRNVLEQIQEIFAAQVFKFTLVLFTGREKMSNREWMVLIHSRTFLDLVNPCRDKYHEINSPNEMNQTHITELLQKINETIKQNKHQHYNNGVFLASQTKIRKNKKKQKEERMYRGKKQGKEARQEQENTTWETFEMESQVEERTTHTVIEQENENCISYVRQTERTTHVYENFVQQENKNVKEKAVNSLDRRLEFSKRRGEIKVVKVLEKSWGMIHTKTYPIASEEELRIVMLGKTGAGKSATGNTILGQKVFEEGFSTESVSQECQKHQHTVDCRIISVIDTPGLFDTKISKGQLKEKIVKCVYMSAPGPHVFLLVIRLDMRFTDEEKNSVKWIQKNFGKDATHYTIVLFTKGDQLKTTIEEFLAKNKQLNELVKQCKGGYHVFNNTDEENRSQVTELLKKIYTVEIKNGGEHYTNEMYKEAQRKIMMKKAKDAALVGASVAGVGAAVAGGAVLVAATGGVALPVALIAGGAALTGGTGAAKAIADSYKHGKEKRSNSTRDK